MTRLTSTKCQLNRQPGDQPSIGKGQSAREPVHISEPLARIMEALAESQRRAVRRLGPGGPPIGRNDPCPCGSGKKFKRCCLAGPRLPLAPLPEATR